MGTRNKLNLVNDQCIYALKCVIVLSTACVATLKIIFQLNQGKFFQESLLNFDDGG